MFKGIHSVRSFFACFDLESLVFLALGVVLGLFLSISYHGMGGLVSTTRETSIPRTVSTSRELGSAIPLPAI